MHPQRLAAIRGSLWLANGFQLYLRNPLQLTLLTVVYLILLLNVNVLPWLGPVLFAVLQPLLIPVLANACRQLADSGQVSGAGLVAGVAENRAALLRLGGLQLLGTVILMIVYLALFHGDAAGEGSAGDHPEDPTAIMLQLALMNIPVVMAFWFAPLLTAWHGLPALKSLVFSCVSAWCNWRAFLTFFVTLALIAAVLPKLALMAAGLVSDDLADVLQNLLVLIMLLVVAPVLMASVFVSYREVFGGDG